MSLLCRWYQWSGKSFFFWCHSGASHIHLLIPNPSVFSARQKEKNRPGRSNTFGGTCGCGFFFFKNFNFFFFYKVNERKKIAHPFSCLTGCRIFSFNVWFSDPENSITHAGLPWNLGRVSSFCNVQTTQRRHCARSVFPLSCEFNSRCKQCSQNIIVKGKPVISGS